MGRAAYAARTGRAGRGRGPTPQGSPFSPLASNLYMRRFVLGWKTLGYAQRFRAEIVNYADDLCVVSKAPAAECWWRSSDSWRG